MDPGAILHSYSPLSGEAMAASASLLAVAAAVVSRVRRNGVRLRAVKPKDAHLQGTGPLLSGIYRNRSVELSMAESGLLYVTARVTNGAGLFSEFSKGDWADEPWLPTAASYRLRAWPERWSVAVRGRSLLFSCRLTAHDPEKMRRALDLACDLADAVDHAR